MGYACNGARFLEKLKDPIGRLYFAVSRDGSRPLHFQRKPYAAVFYVLACIEHHETQHRPPRLITPLRCDGAALCTPTHSSRPACVYALALDEARPQEHLDSGPLVRLG